LGKGDSDVQGYKKPVLEQDYFSSKQTEKKKKGRQNVEESPSPPAKDSGKVGVITSPPTPPRWHKDSATGEQQAQKKKHKFVNLYSQEGQAKDVVLLKGRHPCECQASKHRLINNCLKCGRIVCEQEGSGPCLFCYTLVSNMY
ncbi:unnamed protein product, partial [Timema podura]|nr:unnamed protein product [Timema podura]